MSNNPNTTTVFDPNGDSFEMSRANARDLVEHAGWSYSRPTVVEKIIEVPTKTVEEPAAEEAAEEAADEANEEAAEEAADEGDEEAGDEGDEDETRPVTVEDFADLEDREAAVEYLANNFPDFKPHHKAGRDSLVEKIVELTNA